MAIFGINVRFLGCIPRRFLFGNFQGPKEEANRPWRHQLLDRRNHQNSLADLVTRTAPVNYIYIPSLKLTYSPENGPSQKETIVFQSSIFRCYFVSFREGSWLEHRRFGRCMSGKGGFPASHVSLTGGYT